MASVLSQMGNKAHAKKNKKKNPVDIYMCHWCQHRPRVHAE